MSVQFPNFFNYFKSFYYSNTYLPPVDLSDQSLSKHLLEKIEPKAAEVAQRLISDPEVQKVLSEPLSYDLEKEVPIRNTILTSRGFILLSQKTNLLTAKNVPFYSVSKHPDLPGWIIKAGASRVEDDLLIGPYDDKWEMAFFKKEESLCRIEMVNRVAKAALDAGIEIVTPTKKLVKYANVENAVAPTEKYCVLCQEVDILSSKDTVEAVEKMDVAAQRDLAKKISKIIKKSGLVDASFNNIRLTPEGKPAFIDTEPAGLMVAKKPGLWNRLFPSRGASVEKCARIGLHSLKQSTSCLPKLEAFSEEVSSQYKAFADSPKLSKWKIGISITSFGIIPLIQAITSFIMTTSIKRLSQKMNKMDKDLLEKV